MKPLVLIAGVTGYMGGELLKKLVGAWPADSPPNPITDASRFYTERSAT